MNASSRCIICLESLLSDLNASPCGHVFHSACIIGSLQDSDRCPICRKTIQIQDLLQLFLQSNSNESIRDNFITSPSSVEIENKRLYRQINYIENKLKEEKEKVISIRKAHRTTLTNYMNLNEEIQDIREFFYTSSDAVLECQTLFADVHSEQVKIIEEAVNEIVTLNKRKESLLNESYKSKIRKEISKSLVDKLEKLEKTWTKLKNKVFELENLEESKIWNTSKPTFLYANGAAVFSDLSDIHTRLSVCSSSVYSRISNQLKIQRAINHDRDPFHLNRIDIFQRLSRRGKRPRMRS